MSSRAVLAATVAFGLLALSPRTARAHCDTLDGPVIRDARTALESEDVTPVLKWVAPRAEDEIRVAFQHSLAVRALSPEARSLADRFFFETLVRIHREGEGAPYRGLQPAGTAVNPGIAASDRALETGSVDPLTEWLTAKVAEGLRERYARAAEARLRAAESVERGRQYVAAYVAFMHYAERIVADATAASPHAAHETAAVTRPAEHVH